MKSVKLKPVVLNRDEVFIRPPEFLQCEEQEKWKGSVVVVRSMLREHLMQKKGVKGRSVEKKEEREEEDVKNLSQWKRNTVQVSPVLRKHTFSRQLTNSPGKESRRKVRSVSLAVTKIPERRLSNFTFYGQILTIVAAERMKRVKKEEEILEICEVNMEAEDEIIKNIGKVNLEIDEFKASVRQLDEEVVELKEQIRNCEKRHEWEKKQLKDLEALEYLRMNKVNEGTLEEGKLLIFKEKMRKDKRDLHKKYMEHIEDLKYSLEKAERKLESCDFERQRCKKQLKDYREEIFNLYCRILKEGKDLRTEGLKWIIKALWKNGGFVPVSTFPKFLDEENIVFLVQVSEKDLEIEFLSNKIDQMRTEAKSRRINSSISSSRELYQSVKDRLRDLSRSIMSSRVEIDRVKENRVDEKNSNCYSEISKLREKILKLNDWIKDSTDTEIKRTTESYKLFPGQAEKVGLYHLIRCLVGEKVREFNKYTRNQYAQPKGLLDIKN